MRKRKLPPPCINTDPPQLFPLFQQICDPGIPSGTCDIRPIKRPLCDCVKPVICIAPPPKRCPGVPEKFLSQGPPRPGPTEAPSKDSGYKLFEQAECLCDNLWMLRLHAEINDSS